MLLVALISSGTGEQKEWAAKALCNLVEGHAANQDMI